LIRLKLQSFLLKNAVRLAAFLTAGVLAFIVGYVLYKGIPNLSPELFSPEYTSENVSLFPALVNTITMAVLSLLIAAPLGVFAAIYLVEYAHRGNRLIGVVRMTAETLSGIPSVVYGLFGFLLFVTTLGWGYSLLAGALTLSVMILPIIMRTTEEAVRDRVERMLALALATGSAGVLHYPWAPGRLGEAGHFAGWVRADGTATPALDVVAEMAAFLERNRQRMEEPLPSPVAMVVPSSRLLSSPEQAALAIRRCIRTLVYRNAMPLRAIGEYSLRELESAQLMLLPSPRVLQQDAWETLLSRVEAGACLLVTGPFDRDRYWRRQDRLTAFDLHVRTQPVAREEVLSLYGDPVRLHFGETKTEWVDKAVIEGYPPQVMALKHGRGRLLFSPLPLELADDVEPLAELYEAAIAESGIERPFEVEPHPSGVLAIPLCFESVVLYALVSQIDAACRVTLRHGPERVAIPVDVPAERALLLLVDRATGKVLDRYTPAGA